jgi:hypothetical protein
MNRKKGSKKLYRENWVHTCCALIILEVENVRRVKNLAAFWNE